MLSQGDRSLVSMSDVLTAVNSISLDSEAGLKRRRRGVSDAVILFVGGKFRWKDAMNLCK